MAGARLFGGRGRHHRPNRIGLQTFYRYAERPGAFIFSASTRRRWAFVRELGRVHRGEPMGEDKTYEAVTERAIVRSADGTMRYMIDGDLHSTRGEVELTVGPRVKILVNT